MTHHILLTPTGKLPGRWGEAFPGSVAWALEMMELTAYGADTVVWISAPVDGLPGTVRRVHGLRPELAVVALDLAPSREVATAVFEAGARGYCHALATAPMLQQVAVVVSHGGMWVGPEILTRLVAVTQRGVALSGQEANLDLLSPRERAVAEEVALGATNKEVALHLGITERTVKAHLASAFAKLGVRDRLHLAISFQTRREAVALPSEM
ncbi:MAG: response regulator transcription factor [Zoogloeaceae bacterium]|nr:response regulator transcription factor [Zoogloeaceae bacterium]